MDLARGIARADVKRIGCVVAFIDELLRRHAGSQHGAAQRPHVRRDDALDANARLVAHNASASRWSEHSVSPIQNCRLPASANP